MSNVQFGFKAGHSTIDALLKGTEKWRKAVDEKKFCAVASIDLSKAFDSLDHKILTHKLKAVGFKHNSSALIENYLLNRSQQVKANSEISDWMSMKQEFLKAPYWDHCFSPYTLTILKNMWIAK
jgi:hypothetical protein